MFNTGVYELYTRPGKQLVVYADGNAWNKIPWYAVCEAAEWTESVTNEHPEGISVKTRDIADWARRNGYDSVRINDVYDHGGLSYDYKDAYGDIGIFFNQQDVKSADPATYDDNGNLIPLDQRFTDSPDIRYSFGDEMTEADREAQNIETLKNAGVLSQEDIDAYNAKTSRPLEGKSAKWSQTEGPAQRQFGGKNGMLQESDELDQQAIDYAMQHNAYFPDTNAGQVQRAVNWIRQNGTRKNEDGSTTRISDGFAESLEKVTGKSFDYRSADGQARMIATMAMAVAKNDVSAQVALADAFNRQGTDLGRSLQSRKLFRLMTPEGRIASLQKMLQNTQDEINAKGKTVDLKFSDWIYRAASAAESEADFRMVQKAAASEIAEQVPANWKDKVRSLRMLSMLGNPRTHIRNIVGNAMFVPVVSLKNKLGALGEIVTGQEERTKTLAPVLSKEVRSFAKQDAIKMKDVLTGEAKFNETNMVQQEQKAFSGLLQGLIDFNGDMLEKEDWTFLKGHYKRALGGWMQANGYTAEQLNSNAELLEQGRAYAVQEAQKATYRDFNKLASTLNKVSQEGGAAGFIMDAVLPFKKTPANILRRGIEYSPVSIMKSLTTDIYHLKQYNDYQKGKLDVMPEKAISPNQFIDRVCSGLAGTAVMAVGALLGSAGIVSCGLDDDDDEFEKAKGNQEYAIKFSIGGQDFTYTMDWAAPMSMPFFVGAAIQEQLSSQEGFDVESLVDAFGNITEPVFNLSMLDGVNTLFKTSQYDDTNTITQIGAKIASNYLTSYVPSLLGAVARTVDDTRRKSFVESGQGTGVLGTFRYAREQVENKIPGLSQTNIPYRDVFGNAETSSLAERIFENFISPGYVNAYNSDPVINEMDRLYSANVTDSSSLVPKDPAKTISYKNDKHILTAEEWDQYKVTRGQTAYSMLTDMIGREDYQQADEAAQVQMIKSVWDYADKMGKKSVIPDYEVPEESLDSIVKDGKIASYNTKMLTALHSRDYEGYDTMVEALHEEGVEDGTIKTKISNAYRDKYKEAYLKGDNGTMSEIEDILFNTGYDFDLAKWEKDADEKRGK